MEANDEYLEDDLNDVVGLSKREIPEDQKRKFEGCAAEILASLGMDLNTPGTTDTPRRFICLAGMDQIKSGRYVP